MTIAVLYVYSQKFQTLCWCRQLYRKLWKFVCVDATIVTYWRNWKQTYRDNQYPWDIFQNQYWMYNYTAKKCYWLTKMERQALKLQQARHLIPNSAEKEKLSKLEKHKRNKLWHIWPRQGVTDYFGINQVYKSDPYFPFQYTLLAGKINITKSHNWDIIFFNFSKLIKIANWIIQICKKENWSASFIENVYCILVFLELLYLTRLHNITQRNITCSLDRFLVFNVGIQKETSLR